MGASELSSGLASRLQDIPGVASVAVDLTESGGGINVRLDPGADEIEVMERVRALLVAYGVRSPNPPKLRVGQPVRRLDDEPLGVDIIITPLHNGARVEVITTNIRSFRVVSATPSAIAQGLSDAWCQVVGKIPMEIVSVSMGENGELTVIASNGKIDSSGSANVSDGWEEALARSVGKAIGILGQPSGAIAVNS
ncbi:MAG: hypothetical protein U9N56_07535 [Actinomycetota bacterium]|nr:hypothetical protein [Actinomycetota bacterium]